MLWGAAVGRIETMELALAHGADVNRRALVGNLPDLRQLPDPYPAVTPRDVRGVGQGMLGPLAGALHLAIKMGQDEAVGWLLVHGASVDMWCVSFCDCYNDLDRIPKYETWPVKFCCNPLWYPLHLAICFGRLSTVRILVEAGASLETIVYGKKSITAGPIARPTALQNAAYAGNLEIFDYLLAQYRPEMFTELDVSLYHSLSHGFGIGSKEHRVYIMRRLVQHGLRLGDDAATLLPSGQ
ncbi:hypothetical protein VTH82DRAFT_5409 [Thermothelomyces myriococcoides]